jgi:hypothetical protein
VKQIPYCIICHKHFEEWETADGKKPSVCEGCHLPEQVEPKVEPVQEEVAKPEPTVGEWVVVFLRVDQPTVLKGTDSEPHIYTTREEAEEVRRSIGDGVDEEHGYLKGAWARLVVWSLEAWWRHYRGESGRVFLPVHHLGGELTVDDMNPQEYE